MKGLHRWWGMGCLVAAVLGGCPAAQADSMQLTFSGAVAEPTCAAGVERIVEAQARGAQYYHCTEQARATPGQAAQAYKLSVITGGALPSDRLIGYFASYLNAAPKLVTQTYE